MTTLSKRVIALISAGATALAISSQFIHEKEGDKLTAYMDSGGKYTICEGVTKGTYKGEHLTQAQCDALDEVAIDDADTDVDALVTVPMSKPERAAVISFCGYNLGAARCSKSTFLKLLNDGKRKEACDQIPLWVYDGGRDCAHDKACRGQVLRRDQEQELCLMD